MQSTPDLTDPAVSKGVGLVTKWDGPDRHDQLFFTRANLITEYDQP